MTSRNLKEKDFEKVCAFFDRGVNLTIKINKKFEGKYLPRDENKWSLTFFFFFFCSQADGKTKLKEFEEALDKFESDDIKQLKREVQDFAKPFPLP